MKKVFLSYARKDLSAARKLYDILCHETDTKIWFDKVDLLPGISWKPAIRKSIRESDYFLAVLSKKSVSNRGIRHSELRQALDILDEYPEDKVFLIPIRLDDCEMPFEKLESITYADLFPNWNNGIDMIKRSLGLADDKKKISTQTVTSTKQSSVLQYEYRVGLADLDNNISNLQLVANELNTIQDYFSFTISDLSLPHGAVGNIEGARNLKLYRLSRPFYSDAELLNVDQVICFTKHLLAFEEDDNIYFNYLCGPSEFDERFIFVSAAGMNKYARQAKIKYEMALVHQIVSQLAVYFFNIGYHDELRACPMDFTESHETIVPALKKGEFCKSCTKILKKNKRIYDAFVSLLNWGK